MSYLFSRINERNCLLFLVVLFFLLGAAVAQEPYEPMQMDLADATTNVIWTENYSQGTYHIPYDEWDYPHTQSVVIEYEGEYVVVNEKGPGHAMMLVPFHVLGVEFLFGPLMVALGTFSTYMLGKRLFGWRVGFIGSLLVLTNVTVIVMWHRYYWTDASTMHLFILSLWLLVEANYRFNGNTLDPRDPRETTTNEKLLALGLAALSGLSFGASVSTRYPTALLLVPMLIYLAWFYVLRSWPSLKGRNLPGALRTSTGLWALLLFFLLGLICVLLPLMSYNIEYFGAPFASGYDATSLASFNPDEGLTARNTTESWSGSLGSGLLNAAGNFFLLLPVLVMRMPGLIFLPLGMWFVRKRAVTYILLLLVTLCLFTYLSLAWVNMYARLSFFEILWEPRYFMPALPLIAILAGVGIDGLASMIPRAFKTSTQPSSGENVRTGMKMAALGMVVILLACGLAPAVHYFSMDGRGGAPAPPGPHPANLVVVMTDQLLREPFAYNGRFVLVESATVIDVHGDIIIIRSEGAHEPEGVPIRLDGWPLAERPQVNTGDRVDVMGLFIIGSPPGQPAKVFINVKYDTADFIHSLP